MPWICTCLSNMHLSLPKEVTIWFIGLIMVTSARVLGIVMDVCFHLFVYFLLFKAQEGYPEVCAVSNRKHCRFQYHFSGKTVDFSSVISVDNYSLCSKDIYGAIQYVNNLHICFLLCETAGLYHLCLLASRAKITASAKMPPERYKRRKHWDV